MEIGLLNPRDSLHDRALAASAALGQTRIVTSEMVLTEVLNALAKYIHSRNSTIQAISSITNHPNTEVIPQTALQFRHAVELYRQYLDKEWGLTDCASMTIMRQRGITEVLTHDHHFDQMGYRALLR